MSALTPLLKKCYWHYECHACTKVFMKYSLPFTLSFFLSTGTGWLSLGQFIWQLGSVETGNNTGHRTYKMLGQAMYLLTMAQ